MLIVLELLITKQLIDARLCYNLKINRLGVVGSPIRLPDSQGWAFD